MDQKKEKLQFPQNFDIKIIIEADIPAEESKANISRALSECKTIHSFVNIRTSAKGNYNTYSYNIDIDSQEQMNAVYETLRKIQGAKFVL